MQFRCAHWERFLRRSNISGYFSPIYYQRANPVDRRNQEIKKILRAQILDQPPAQWDERLDDISFAINNRRNAATGLPPSHILLGAPLTRPGNQQHPNVLRPAANDAQARADRVRHARVHQEHYQAQVFPVHRDAPVQFQVGQRVWTRAFYAGQGSALRPTWEGPYRITAEFGNGVYQVRRGDSDDRVHVDDLRPAHGPAPDPRRDVDVLARPPPPDDMPWPAEGPQDYDDDDDEEDAHPEAPHPDPRHHPEAPDEPQAGPSTCAAAHFASPICIHHSQGDEDAEPDAPSPTPPASRGSGMSPGLVRRRAQPRPSPTINLPTDGEEGEYAEPDAPSPTPHQHPEALEEPQAAQLACIATHATTNNPTILGVLVEDYEDEEEMPRNAPSQGVPIVGLWP
ncbi:hypothetical protein NQ318_007503 [Aromia moschata]|uniref:Integrase catalytic domain-containing protein n=1 Tax=Aromia moschata TaxID=1265417 RepID=A0AAV8YG31_9CUCU|nr:hypothetical protein NQ318_007503 [Aromia moschata]